MQNSPELPKAIYKTLQKCCDSPTVLFCAGLTDPPLLWQKESSKKKKKVVLLCTEYYTYLIRRAELKVEARWANRRLSINVQDKTIILSCAIILSSTRVLSAKQSSTSTPARSSGNSIKASESHGKSTVWNKTGDAKKKKLEHPLQGATVVAFSPSVAQQINQAISKLIEQAGEAAALLNREEVGNGGSSPFLGSSSPPHASSSLLGQPDDSEDPESEAHTEDSENEEMEESGSMNGRGLLHTDAGPFQGGTNKLEELLRFAPSRYTALTSLVDGEVADYRALRHAYHRHEEDQLLHDLDVFIKENEGQVEALCQTHYSSFIHAIEQCLMISPQDAQAVGERLSAANAMVRTAVVNIKDAAAEMQALTTTCTNLEATRSLLEHFLTLVQTLEVTEAQIAKGKLQGGVIAIRELVMLAAPLSGFVLGEYVLHRRVPALTQEVLQSAVHQLNSWLRRLRHEAVGIGKAAMEWKGIHVPGRVSKRTVFAPEGDWWWIGHSFLPAETKMAPFIAAETVMELSNGAGIQQVFEELHRGEDFRRYYCEGRMQQAQADFFNASYNTNKMPAERIVEEFEEFCCAALGFILIEDLVHSATSPHVQSCSEILRSWDQLTASIASHLSIVSSAIHHDPQYSTHVLRLMETLRRLLRHSLETVKSVELNPLVLLKVMESYTDSVVSTWLQDTCIQLTMDVLSDPLLALQAENKTDFEQYVTRFHFHLCSSMQLNVPEEFPGIPFALPYGELIPKVGKTAIEFLRKCCDVMVLDSSSAIRHSELNNVTEMVLKYVMVLFRTVAEAMRQLENSSSAQSVLKCALFLSSCTVMPVIVSCVEEEFLLHGTSDMRLPKQKLGSPIILKACADLFTKPAQDGLEKVLRTCIADVKARLALSATITYWYKQLDLREANEEQRLREECFENCIQYILQLIPQLSSLLSGDIVRSIISTAMVHVGQSMQSCVETALKRAYAGSDRNFNAMRACVGEFEMQCLRGVPRWQYQLRLALPGLRAAERFPLDTPGAVEAARAWIAVRETQETLDKQNSTQLISAMEDARKAISKGVMAIGKTFDPSFKKKE